MLRIASTSLCCRVTAGDERVNAGSEQHLSHGGKLQVSKQTVEFLMLMSLCQGCVQHHRAVVGMHSHRVQAIRSANLLISLPRRVEDACVAFLHVVFIRIRLLWGGSKPQRHFVHWGFAGALAWGRAINSPGV